MHVSEYVKAKTGVKLLFNVVCLVDSALRLTQTPDEKICASKLIKSQMFLCSLSSLVFLLEQSISPPLFN